MIEQVVEMLVLECSRPANRQVPGRFMIDVATAT
jgi:hypothetical protein